MLRMSSRTLGHEPTGSKIRWFNYFEKAIAKYAGGAIRCLLEGPPGLEVYMDAQNTSSDNIIAAAQSLIQSEFGFGIDG